MAIRKFRAGQTSYSADTYVGTYGTVFYDEDNGRMRISDGVTPGGNPLTLVSSDFEFTFGDFVASTPPNGAASLTAANDNQNISLVTNGTGTINVVGDFHVHTSATYNPNVIDTDGAIFRVNTTGQIRMLVPLADSVEGALEIIGNTSGVSHPPNQTGVILHVTGNDGLVSRNYFDASNSYPLIVGRRYNGLASNTSPVLTNELMMRIAAQGSTDNGFELFGPARVDFVATQNQSPTTQGGEVQIFATPNNKAAITDIVKVATFNGDTGLTATKFNGPLTGNVTGNIISTNTGSTVLNTSGATAIFTGNVTGTASTLKGSVISSNTNNTVLDTSSAIALFTGNVTGKLIHTTRDAGTIAAGGTLTIDFSTDDIVKCVWGDGLVLSYQNYTAGRIVRVLATKAAGTGTDSISLDGVTASQVSTGSTAIAASADVTTYIELICTNSTLASLFIKL